jgi:twinkle protein
MLPAAAGGASALHQHQRSWVAELAEVQRVKLRSIADKRMQAMTPKGGDWGMFGAHTVPIGASAVVVTEGEFDAMAVHQATGAHAVSVPNGSRSLPVQLLPWFERFQKVYLWMDEDGPGWEGAQMMARKLGLARCSLVRTSEGMPSAPPDPAVFVSSPSKPQAWARAKDANDALRSGYDLSASILAAAPLPHSEVLQFSDLRAAVVHEVTDRQALSGDPIRVLPGLQSLVKGHRRGELTVLTGPTGAGKTTLLGQLSVDLAAQGVPTLWGSFEVKSTRLLRVLMHQYLGRSLDGASREEVEAAADQFEALPIKFLRYFGPTDVEGVLEAMRYSAYAHDTAHVVLDNLQFMMSGTSKVSRNRMTIACGGLLLLGSARALCFHCCLCVGGFVFVLVPRGLIGSRPKRTPSTSSAPWPRRQTST